MKSRTTLISALTAALLVAPATAHAQIDVVEFLLTQSGQIVVTDQTPAYPARVIAPRNFLEQGRRGTLRELELEVPPGPLSDAFARSHRTRVRLPALGLKARQQRRSAATGSGAGSEYLVWELKNVRVTSYNISGATDADKFSRVKVQFQPPPAQSSGPGAPVPGIEGSPVGTAGAPQQPPGGAPVPGIEGSPVGTAGAPSGRPRPGTAQLTAADLLPVNGLQLASKLIPWGQAATMPTSQASSKHGGRCEFRYTYYTANQGQALAGPATNLVLLDAPTGAPLTYDALPGLAVAAQHKSSGTLWLKPGTWTLYVHADGKEDIAESDEQNNLRRVRVQVEGSCD